MRHHNLQVTGSVVVNGLGVATASELTAYTASTDAKISTLQAFTSSVGTTNTFTASASGRLNSIETISASNIGRLNAIETITSSNVARLNAIETITASNVSRLNSLEAKTGSLATTGSNTFIGTQTITGSLYISSDLIVQGSSSLQNITASAVSIGTNLINLNTANPAIRYAGLVIGDSGSIGSSGSFLYDSVQDEMIFVHRGANTTVTSSVVLMGPQTFDNIGSETYPTSNIIQKGTGNEHLVDSCIFDDGTTTCIKNNLIGTGTISGTTIYGSTNVCSPVGTFSGCIGIGITNPSTNLDINATGGLGGWTGIKLKTGTSSVQSLSMGQVTAGNGAWIGTAQYNQGGYWQTEGTAAAVLNFESGGEFRISTNSGLTANTNYNITERLRITSTGNVGINTTTPNSVLHIEASNNTTNQFRVNSCDGLNAGVRSYTTCDGPGLLINHYYAVGGSPYLRTSDFVSNQGDGASTQMRFFTKDFNANPALAMIITSGRSVGIGTDTPSLHSSSSGLVVKGINGCRGIIEVWDGTTSGKAVFQQVNGTTYLGNLDKGTGTGELQLMVNGAGTSATTAMTLTKCGHIVVNQSPNGQADYGRMTISTCMSKQMSCSSQEHTVLHLSTCESDTPFGMKIAIFGNTCSTSRYISMQTGDHYISNQGNIAFQSSGGNVGIGTTSPNYKLDVYTTGGNSVLRINSDTSQNSQIRLDEASTVKFAITYVPSDSSTRVYFAGYGTDIITLKGSSVLIGTTTSSGYGILNTYKAPVSSNYVDQIVVQGTGNYPSLRLGTYDTYDGVMATTGNDLRILSGLNVTTENHNIRFYTSFNGGTTGAQNYERMRIEYNGNVGIGTASPQAKLTVAGTILNTATAGGDNFTLDTMNAYQSIANGGWVDFNAMSGFLMVNNWTNGATTLFVMGGGNTGVVGTITGTAGTMHHSPGVGGYRWCNNYGSTANFGFQVFRTRNTA